MLQLECDMQAVHTHCHGRRLMSTPARAPMSILPKYLPFTRPSLHVLLITFNYSYLHPLQLLYIFSPPTLIFISLLSFSFSCVKTPEKRREDIEYSNSWKFGQE